MGTSSMDHFEYDVAFSFLGDDHTFASRLNDLLHDRFRTFIYLEAQEKLAGTDGEETLNAVFSLKARVVVVLYRERWGSTPFTRIEATAIRNRAYEEGYDFVIFALLAGENPPQWLPKARIWPNLNRWGIEGLAAVIEARIHQAGGSPREESATERAARLDRILTTANARHHSLREAGTDLARRLFQELGEEIDSLVAKINQSTSIRLEAVREKDLCIVRVGFWVGGRRRGFMATRYSLSIHWHNLRGNRSRPKLKISLWSGSFETQEQEGAKPPDELQKPRELSKEVYKFDMDDANNFGWRESSTGCFHPNQALADYFVSLLLKRIE
ncbi:MAG TPA: hypothetical protein VFQ76_19800 [Longimicrobiaceae bacterium]|nr:hypothetical protein [Longimicrobiaceae bacterium]